MEIPKDKISFKYLEENFNQNKPLISSKKYIHLLIRTLNKITPELKLKLISKEEATLKIPLLKSFKIQISNRIKTLND